MESDFMELIRLEIVDEFRISLSQDERIRHLMEQSFPEEDCMQSRSYLKQLPQRRLLAWLGEELIGHVALEYRVIGADGDPFRIFGLLDVCVDSRHVGNGVASMMLAHLEEIARQSRAEFMVLFATDERLYLRNGYHRPPGRTLRWLRVDEHQSFGTTEEEVEELMIKGLSERDWPEGAVDLLGHLF